MLKQRVATAVVLVAVVLLTLASNQAIYWQAFINLAIFVGFWEWLRFCKVESNIVRFGLFLLFAGVCAATQMAWIPTQLAISLACILWLILMIFTMTDHLDFLHGQTIKLLIGIWILAIGGLVVIELKSLHHGIYWIMGFMVSVWAADIGAYFVGKRFGKTKLAPQVSPGKTIEGLVGGLLFSLLIFTPIIFNIFEPQQRLILLAAVIVLVLVSVMGDLFESKQKRYAGLKDSSQILPGHGGVLDRIDSLLSAAPFFAITLMILGYW